MNAFYQATVEIGVAPQVTTFTLSDFGRTFAARQHLRHRPCLGQPSLDHGWSDCWRGFLRNVSDPSARWARRRDRSRGDGFQPRRSINTARHWRSGSACRRPICLRFSRTCRISRIRRWGLSVRRPRGRRSYVVEREVGGLYGWTGEAPVHPWKIPGFRRYGFFLPNRPPRLPRGSSCLRGSGL